MLLNACTEARATQGIKAQFVNCEPQFVQNLGHYHFSFIPIIHLLCNSENVLLHLGLSDLPWEMGVLVLTTPLLLKTHWENSLKK